MASEELGGDLARRPRHPYIDEHRAEQGRPRVIALAGLLGDSHRPGCRSMFVTRDLTRSVEFRVEDVTAEREIPAEQPPFIGLTVTEVQLKSGAEVFYVRSAQMEDWDVATRLGGIAPEPGGDNPDRWTESACAITGMRRSCKCPDAFWIADPDW